MIYNNDKNNRFPLVWVTGLLNVDDEVLAARRLQPVPRRFGAFWIFIRGGCSGWGVQWMGVVLYNRTAYNLM